MIDFFSDCFFLPSSIDGFKPAQRKIIYTCFNHIDEDLLKIEAMAGIVLKSTVYS